MLSQLDSYAAYMAHKVRSNFIEAEKAILKTIKELEDENTFDIETVGYVWCLHGEVCGDLKQFDRLRESFRVALKKTNNSPLVRLYYIRALVYHSIDFKFSLDMAGELANEINQLDPHNLSEGELPPNYYLTKINWYLSYAYCEVLDSDSLLLALNHLLSFKPSNTDGEIDAFCNKLKEKCESLTRIKDVYPMVSKVLSVYQYPIPSFIEDKK